MTTTNSNEALYRVWLCMGGSGALREIGQATLWTESEARRVLPETSSVRYAFVGRGGRGESTSEGWRLQLVTDETELAAARAERARLAGPRPA